MKLLHEPSGQEASLPVAAGMTLLKPLRRAPVCSRLILRAEVDACSLIPAVVVAAIAYAVVSS